MSRARKLVFLSLKVKYAFDSEPVEIGVACLAGLAYADGEEADFGSDPFALACGERLADG